MVTEYQIGAIISIIIDLGLFSWAMIKSIKRKEIWESLFLAFTLLLTLGWLTWGTIPLVSIIYLITTRKRKE